MVSQLRLVKEVRQMVQPRHRVVRVVIGMGNEKVAEGGIEPVA